MKGRLLVATLAVAALAGAGSIAWASIPDGKGVVHGCYAKLGGALRVIDTAKNQVCGGSELAVTWNQKGPTGSKGATGGAGPKGTTGAKGPTGPSGSAIVARIRSTGAQATTQIATNYPVTGASWTQAGNEVDTISGVVDVTVPPFVDCALYSQAVTSVIPPAIVSVAVSVDGDLIGSYVTDSHGNSGQFDFSLPKLFEPGSAVNHAVTVEIKDNCEAIPPENLQHFTINSLALDVEAAR
jgi:hypothetical protein